MPGRDRHCSVWAVCMFCIFLHFPAFSAFLRPQIFVRRSKVAVTLAPDVQAKHRTHLQDEVTLDLRYVSYTRCAHLRRGAAAVARDRVDDDVGEGAGGHILCGG
jgi:hypothetical protein